VNLYQALGDNPEVATDPSGLAWRVGPWYDHLLGVPPLIRYVRDWHKGRRIDEKINELNDKRLSKQDLIALAGSVHTNTRSALGVSTAWSSLNATAYPNANRNLRQGAADIKSLTEGYLAAQTAITPTARPVKLLGGGGAKVGTNGAKAGLTTQAQKGTG